MYTIAELAERVTKVDQGEHKTLEPDVLEFNYYLLTHYFHDYAVEIKRQHDMETAMLREYGGTGIQLTALLRRALRAGRKTIRIADVLAEAEKRWQQQQRESSTP